MNKKTRIIIARSLVMTALISVGNEFAEGRAIPVSASEVNRSRDTYSDTESKKEYVQNKFFNAINNLEDKVSFDLYGAEGYELSQEDIREYYESFLFEHPEIFYVADTDFWQISRMENDSCEIYIGYIYDKDDIPSMKDKLEEKIAKILNNISSYDEVRKTYEIYDYIRLNNSYSEEYDEADIDYSGCETIDERLERIKGNKDFFEAHSVYGTLVNETSVWKGYSRALNMLLKKEEIESGVIRNGDYGWNYVNINGQYYRLRINYDEDYNKYLSNPYKYFNFSDRYNYLEDNGDVGLGFEFNDTTYDDIFRNSNDDETGSKNVVRIEDKLYHLDYEYKLYTYNLNGTNKKYIYNFNKSGSYNTTIRFMKSYKKYLYFVSYQFVNEKYICIIKRYNIETQKIEQVLNLNTALNIDIINETYINKINFYIKNEIIYIDYDERDESFELGDLNIKEEDSYDDPSDDPTDDGNDDSSDGADDDNNDDDDDENWPDDDYNSSDNIVNINDKIYFLDDEYKLYYSNTDGSNKTYLYDFTLNNKNTIVRYMKGYGVYIYYISYEYVNEKYICIIRRYNTITEVLEEVVNLNNKFDINIKYEYINKITFYIEANIIFINYIGKTYTFNLSQISGENTTIIINNKVYYLSEDYKLYSSNIDGSNNKYVYDLTLNKKNTIIKYMKAYDNQLYYISYEYVNGKYIGIINRFDIETGRVYEVINLNEVLNIDIKYEHLTIIYFYIKNRILYIDYMGTIRTFNLSNFIEGSSNDLYLEALEYVRTFEKKLTHSTYKKALNAVRELSESDKKDKLLKRIKEAKKEMDREDTDIDDSYEENLYQDNNTVIIPFGTQLNDVLSPLHNSVNIGALNSINSYNNSYNPALPGQWIFTEGNWYHVNDDLRFTTGWLKYNNSMYYFDSNGAMATGWRNIGNNTYCFTDEGVMITGWIKDDNTGKWYYLQDDGTMVRGTVKCGYLFGSDGAWIDK